MENLTIEITCKGAETVGIDELQDLQGNLKDLTEAHYVKLRNSITQLGFSFPIFFWTDPDGKKWILDAHQRKRTLLKMREEGWTIPPLPADPIFAKDKNEAKKKLLLLNSQYGKMTRKGYDEFTTDLPMDDITDMLVLDGVFHEEGEKKPKKPKEVTCPSCSNIFTI